MHWVRFILAWGRRRAAPDQPAPPLPKPESTEDDDDTVIPYPHFYIYNTPEEALAEVEIRSKTLNFPVPPLPPVLAGRK